MRGNISVAGLAAVLIGLLLLSGLAGAQPQGRKAVVERLGLSRQSSYTGFSGMQRTALDLSVSEPGWVLAPPWMPAARISLVTSLGRLERDPDEEIFLAIGPALRWQLGNGSPRWFVDAGIRPTVLSGSEFRGSELGGRFHFTSHLAAGVAFGPRHRLSLAVGVVHISNARLRTPNPGADLAGIMLEWDFAR